MLERDFDPKPRDTILMLKLIRKAREMHNAIDMMEGAMMGLGTDIPTGSDFLRQAELWEAAPDNVIIAPHITVGQLRRVVAATVELTRIINSDEYNFGPRT